METLLLSHTDDSVRDEFVSRPDKRILKLYHVDELVIRLWYIYIVVSAY